MNNKLPPQEPMVILPLGMDCSIGLPSPYRIRMSEDVMKMALDALTTSKGIARINPADLYKKDDDNEQ